MSTSQPANIPLALSTARRQFDHWRSQQPNKRTRPPEELWQQAVALAKEHGLNKTVRALGLRYYSLKKHLDETRADSLVPTKPTPDLIGLLPGTMSSGGFECMIEWVDGSDVTVRTHIKGSGLPDLAAYKSFQLFHFSPSSSKPTVLRQYPRAQKLRPNGVPLTRERSR